MRGKLAKKIRREIFGDQSTRGKRRYATEKTTGVRVNMGLRKAYLQLKKRVKQLIEKGEQSL